jgi:pimeloyl-ACP methyl ester carboxylesterase
VIAALLLSALLAAPPAPTATPAIETVFERVAPADAGTVTRSAGQTRAVVLLHGLRTHPFSAKQTRAAVLHDWQRPGSSLVTALGEHADVYSFGYGQNASIPDIAKCAGLHDAIAALDDAGYEEIVLVGHSAGGVISRELVETFPEIGVTKVVQVSPPNGGSQIVRMTPYIHAEQVPFLRSIRADVRAAIADRKIPDGVEMVVVIGDGFAVGDLAVRDEYQWPPDLQAQGIPAVQLRTMHFTAMRSRWVIPEIVKLVTEPQPRWTAEQVSAARQQMVESAFERGFARTPAPDTSEDPLDPPPPAP